MMVGKSITASEINNELNESLHFADKNSVQLILANTDKSPANTKITCNCPKLILGRFMMENSIWKDVFKHSVPKARLIMDKWITIPKMNTTTKIQPAASILVTANFTRPFFVQRIMLSLPV